jgi:general stress protein 26
MSSPEQKEKIWSFIKDIKVGMLTEHDGQDLRSRPMHLVQDDYDGTIWFFIKHDNGRVYAHQQKNKQVCLSFCDHENNVHVSLSGETSLCLDKELIERLWSPFAAAWFPEGKDDPNLALLEIKIHKGEYWDSKSNMFAQLYEIAKANLTDEKPDMGENKKFGKHEP